MMIPKIIHYCWFGKAPLPELAKRCIASWRMYMPEYEIKEWNESNFDVGIIAYTQEAYLAGKYAFVSDYARFWILYNYGGVYFDTDVEIIKPLSDIIYRGPFMGVECNSGDSCAPGLGLAATMRMPVYKTILDYYNSLHFKKADGTFDMTTVVSYTSRILIDRGLTASDDIQFIAGVYIYPKDYFCPVSPHSKRMLITDNTRTIHHYAGTWVDPTLKNRMKKKAHRILNLILGEIGHDKVVSLIRAIKRMR